MSGDQPRGIRFDRCPKCQAPVALTGGAGRCVACGETIVPPGATVDAPGPEAFRRAADAADATRKPKQYDSIGGFLIVFAIVMGIGLLRYLLDIGVCYETLDRYRSQRGMEEQVEKLGLILLWDIVMALAALVILIAFFLRKSFLPKIVVGFFIAQIAFALLVSTTVRVPGRLLGDAGKIMLPLVVGGFWITYFLISERVERTFVR